MSTKLFDNDESEDEVTFKSNSDYAKKYNTLRRKEEMLKLKNRLGADALPSDESSSSEDDEDEVVLSEGFEHDFFKTLSYLKKKDPKIYDSKTRFFETNPTDMPSTSKKKFSKTKPLTIRDYNREAILETGGKFSEDEDKEIEENGRSSPTYVQEQRHIKQMFSSVLQDEDSEEEKADIGGLFVKKKKSKEEEEEEEKHYHEWLGGQAASLKNNKEEKELNALKDYWSNPDLDEGEAFLRDYFLNQRFIDKTDKDRVPSYDEIVNDEDISEDEKVVGKQLEFEHKFNFRFEEPDQDFIKRYPRTLEYSMRHKDNKRAKKRSEVKERKLEEKRKKKEEIAQLKSLKLKEIQEKIEKLKEITGNDQLAFKDEDIEGDFDPDEHDRRMKELFNENYYGETVDSKKPHFSDIEDMDAENWDEWETNKDTNEDQDEPHCEDETFNMDCDYDPGTSKKDNLFEKSDVADGKRRKRKRKNKLAEILAQKKPVFDPEKMDKTFSEYLDEYYKLDCEDVIGDMPCRFKYREVPACDYGLSTAEILMADDQDLNRWYPLKKTLQYRPEHRQWNDQRVYASKSRNEELKRKLLPSLYGDTNDNEENDNEETSSSKKKKKKRKNKKRGDIVSQNVQSEQEVTMNGKEIKKKKNRVDDSENFESEANVVVNEKEKMKKKSKNTDEINNEENKKNKQYCDDKDKTEKNAENVEENNEVSVAEVKKKKKKNNKKIKEDDEDLVENVVDLKEKSLVKNEDLNVDSKKKKKKRKLSETLDVGQKDSPPMKKKKNKQNNSHNANKQTSKNTNNDPIKNITDERLKAYGLNPKKYRSFMKYKKY